MIIGNSKSNRLGVQGTFKLFYSFLFFSSLQLEAENDELRHELSLAINHAREAERKMRKYEDALLDATEEVYY